MSHEIRTPMNGIIGMSELMGNTDLSEDQAEYLTLIQQSADSLLHLLNDILDFSKIEAGKLSLESIPFSLRDCIGKTARTLAVRAAAKDLELTCRIDPELPDMLLGDPGRFRQIIVNLAGNAIKFTERGEVMIDVAPASGMDDKLQKDKLHLRVSVKDTGVGIAPDKQAAIFEAFSQADTSTTREYGGTGLGLAISLQLVEMIGGKIWLESEVGKGTTFHFTGTFGVLPEQLQRAPTQLTSLSGMPILVVDDNATNRRILQEMLGNWELAPTAVADGEGALAELRRAARAGQPYQLAILDMMMPGMDGIAVAEQVKQHRELAGLTIIMLSSAGQPADSECREQLEIAHYMTKPVLQSELLEAILEAMGEPDVEEIVARAPARIKANRQLKILLAEDGVVNQRVAVGLLERRGDDVVLANNGREAFSAVQRESFDLILMDLQMPEMDGLAATVAIRQWEQTQNRRTPIIAMTAAAMQSDRENCTAAGMDDYISKPVKPAELDRVLNQYAQSNTRPAASSATSHPPGNAAEPGDPSESPVEANMPPREGTELTGSDPAAAGERAAADAQARTDAQAGTDEQAGTDAREDEQAGDAEMADFDLEVAAEQIAGGVAGVREVAELLLSEYPNMCTEIDEALRVRDGPRLQRAAHTMKGAAEVFGARPVVEAGQRLELLAQSEQFDDAAKALDDLRGKMAQLETALRAYLRAHS